MLNSKYLLLCSAPLFCVLSGTLLRSLFGFCSYLIRSLRKFLFVYSLLFSIVNFLKYENKENWKSKWKLVKTKKSIPSRSRSMTTKNSSSLTNVYSTYVPSIFSSKTYSQVRSLAQKSLYMAHSNTIMQNNMRLIRVLI